MLPAHNPSIRLTNSIEFGVIVLIRARERRSQDESDEGNLSRQSA